MEAVFEDPKVKAEVTAKVDAATGPDCIFATNTSTLPISALARASARPANFIGIHFFSPVDKMMLVEIIRGKETGDRAVAKALDFVRQFRKTPIVVNDARFFYANRCIIPYINEGIRMVAEGVEPALVENAAKLVGMPLGPLQLVDETSIDLGVKIAKATKAAMGDAYPDGAVDTVLFAMADQGRLGKKANAGFYSYDATGKREGLWDGLAKAYPVADSQPALTEVQHRLLFAQVLEAVRALEEGVLMDIREGDVGAILGWGFAPWSGGPFSWLDMHRRAPRGRALRCADRDPRPPLRRPRAAARDGGEGRDVLRPLRHGRQGRLRRAGAALFRAALRHRARRVRGHCAASSRATLHNEGAPCRRDGRTIMVSPAQLHRRSHNRSARRPRRRAAQPEPHRHPSRTRASPADGPRHWRGQRA